MTSLAIEDATGDVGRHPDFRGRDLLGCQRRASPHDGRDLLLDDRGLS